MSAVAEISKPSETVMFAAKREDMRLVWKPRYPIFGPAGEKVGERVGKTVKFSEGTLRIPESGFRYEDGRPVEGPEETAELLKWLRSHHLFGDVHEGFLEVQEAAPAVSPAEMDAILEAATDPEALAALIAAEEQGWARDDLLGPARRQLERAEAAWAEIRAQAAESEKPAPKRRAS